MSKDNKWYSLSNEQTSSTTFFYDDYNSNRAQLIQYTNNPSIPPHPCSTFFKRKNLFLQKPPERKDLAALLMNRSRCSPSFRFEEQSLSEKTQGMKLYNVIFYYYPVPDASNHCSSPNNNNKLSFNVERSL